VINFGKKAVLTQTEVQKIPESERKLKGEFMMDGFNLCKEKFEELTSIMQHALKWVEQRSDYLSRVVAQKVGLLYSLP